MFDRLKKKAEQSNCRYKVAAMGLNKKGDLIAYTTNRPRFSKPNGSIHAEMALMAKYGPDIHTIVILRVNRHGNLAPIHPCKKCQQVAEILGIKIKTVEVER